MDKRPCILPHTNDRGVCSARVYHVEVYCIVTGTSGASKKPARVSSNLSWGHCKRTEEEANRHDLTRLVAAHLAYEQGAPNDG